MNTRSSRKSSSPFVGQAERVRLVGQKSSDFLPVKRKLGLLLKVPQVV